MTMIPFLAVICLVIVPSISADVSTTNVPDASNNTIDSSNNNNNNDTTSPNINPSASSSNTPTAATSSSDQNGNTTNSSNSPQIAPSNNPNPTQLQTTNQSVSATTTQPSNQANVNTTVVQNDSGNQTPSPASQPSNTDASSATNNATNETQTVSTTVTPESGHGVQQPNTTAAAVNSTSEPAANVDSTPTSKPTENPTSSSQSQTNQPSQTTIDPVANPSTQPSVTNASQNPTNTDVTPTAPSAVPSNSANPTIATAPSQDTGEDVVPTPTTSTPTTATPTTSPPTVPVNAPSSVSGDSYQPTSQPTRESIEMPEFLLDVIESDLSTLYITIIESDKSIYQIDLSKIEFYCDYITLNNDNNTKLINNKCNDVFVKSISWINQTDPKVNPNEKFKIELQNMDEINFLTYTNVTLNPTISLRYINEYYNIINTIDISGIKQGIYTNILNENGFENNNNNGNGNQEPEKIAIDFSDPKPTFRNITMKLNANMLKNDFESELMINFHCHKNCNNSLAGIHISFCENAIYSQFVRCSQLNVHHQLTEYREIHHRRTRALRRVILSSDDNNAMPFVKFAMIKPNITLMDKNINIPIVFDKEWFVTGYHQMADIQLISPKYNWDISTTIDFDVVTLPTFELVKLFDDKDIDITTNEIKLDFGFHRLNGVIWEKSTIMAICRLNHETAFSSKCNDYFKCHQNSHSCTFTFEKNSLEYNTTNTMIFTLFNQDNVRCKQDKLATFHTNNKPKNENDDHKLAVVLFITLGVLCFSGIFVYAMKKVRSRFNEYERMGGDAPNNIYGRARLPDRSDVDDEDDEFYYDGQADNHAFVVRHA